MKELKDLVQELKEMKLEQNAKGKISQTDSRKFKAVLHEVTKELYRSVGFDCYDIQNGMYVEISNDELGSVIIESKSIVKSSYVDVEAEAQDYQDKLKLQAEKLKEKQANKNGA